MSTSAAIAESVTAGPAPRAVAARWRVAPRVPAEPPGVVAARCRRVTVLALATVALGVADLAFTLTYMRWIGMAEVNPIARAMIAIGGSRQLILYKLFTIALSCGIMYLLRRRRQAEVCAWFCCAAMVGLTLYWLFYNDLAASEAIDPVVAASDHRWVTLPD